ncbi:hypothetical protein B488_06730 [Liberibacter crescens BT-1]|uniref:Uncharacterized protein n=1 Tax=Liberibacter crescens (strain BT-1) TaxID=1215343 RepID=L0EUZ7_LIBCB|nr:hypothetical protein B488_06730 [Liberibacter crescens BT-1]
MLNIKVSIIEAVDSKLSKEIAKVTTEVAEVKITLSWHHMIIKAFIALFPAYKK